MSGSSVERIEARVREEMASIADELSLPIPSTDFYDATHEILVTLAQQDVDSLIELEIDDGRLDGTSLDIRSFIAKISRAAAGSLTGNLTGAAVALATVCELLAMPQALSKEAVALLALLATSGDDGLGRDDLFCRAGEVVEARTGRHPTTAALEASLTTLVETGAVVISAGRVSLKETCWIG